MATAMITIMPTARAYPRPTLWSTSPLIWALMTRVTRLHLAGGQLVGRGLGPERVAEEQDHRPQQRRGEDRQGDVAPVLAEVAPRFAEASRQSWRRPSMAGAMMRTMSGNWKYM